MTLGQRIQDLRKQRGLSQEALGEAMGVSRQAISKWEGDATIPEVEKLVALSRLFSVTVGALLGVETAPEDACPEEDAPEQGEPAEPDLRLAEEIAGRYVAALEQRQRRGRRKGICLGLIATAVAASLIGGQFSQMGNSIRQVQQNLSYINNTVSGQISGITGRIEEILQSQNDVTAASGYLVRSVDLAAGTFRLELTATPKALTEGTTAQFILSSPDFAPLTFDGVPQGTTFHGEVDLPLTDEVTPTVVFNDGVEKRTQVLETIWRVKAGTEMEFEAHPSGGTSLSGGMWTIDWNLNIRCASYDTIKLPEPLNLVPVSLTVLTYHNGAVVDELPVPLEAFPSAPTPPGHAPTDWDIPVPYQRSFRVATGDTLEVVVRMEDNYGQVFYRPAEGIHFITDKAGDMDIERIDYVSPFQPPQ